MEDIKKNNNALLTILCKTEEALPKYQTEGSSGMDLCSNEEIDLLPNQIKLVSTGLFLEIPEGFEIQIRSRSGMALKGIIVVNAPGTIDSDYRGEIKIILTNLSKESFLITKGMRIAQMVCSEVVKMNLKKVESLEKTDRNEGGFGSTKF